MIDKTYSKTISDETKFYTSDTALELVFKLKETEYTFESAEIVLLNIDDRSLVTRPVAKVLDGFTYELDDDIIPHYGDWQGQLRFEAGEIYVSSPVKFRIENDLSNDRPPQLSDVQSWVSLKRYADDLIDELKQAVLSIEGVEDNFNENETVRQTTFETNEIERQSAELIRVENENQRNIDHENRSAEFNGKADKVVIKNIVENGDFSKDFNGWEVKGNVQNINGRVKLVRMTGNSLASLSYRDRAIFASRNDVYYMFVEGELVNRTSGGDGVMINDTVNVLPVWMLRSQPKGVVSNSSIVFNLSPNNTPYVYANTSEGSEYFIDHIIIVNLTETFGAGNEPTKEEMDELVKVTGYIEGEHALNNKEMLIWTLALIRRNRNAIITLGGTV